jgi:hypothetical protein
LPVGKNEYSDAVGSIDPRKAGTSLTSRDRLDRLSRKAVRIPTASGNVYYDYSDTYCYAHASGVDRARTIALLESELKRLHISFDKAPVRHPEGQVKDGRRSADLVILIGTPASSSTAPMLVVTYSDDPSVLSIGTALGQ